MTINYKKLGKKIKEFRLLKGLSQEQLAEECNLSTSYISYIETGKKKINFSQLEKISKKLNFSIDIYPLQTENKIHYEQIFANCSTKEKEFYLRLLSCIKKEFETSFFDW